MDRLEAVLLRPTRNSIVRALRNVPAAPREAGEYGRIYNLLKAYLMTTTDAKKIEPAFLDSLLMDRWLEGRQVDSARLELVRKQFDFYARKLCVVYACGADADAAVVNPARNFLLAFAGPEQIYNAIIGEASTRNPPVRFAQKFPAASAVLGNVYDVPGGVHAGRLGVHAPGPGEPQPILPVRGLGAGRAGEREARTPEARRAAAQNVRFGLRPAVGDLSRLRQARVIRRPARRGPKAAAAQRQPVAAPAAAHPDRPEHGGGHAEPRRRLSACPRRDAADRNRQVRQRVQQTVHRRAGGYADDRRAGGERDAWRGGSAPRADHGADGGGPGGCGATRAEVSRRRRGGGGWAGRPQVDGGAGRPLRAGPRERARAGRQPASGQFLRGVPAAAREVSVHPELVRRRYAARGRRHLPPPNRRRRP